MVKKNNKSGYAIVKAKFDTLNADYKKYKETVKKIVDPETYKIIVEVLRGRQGI